MSHQKIIDENQQKSLEIEELQQKNLRLSVKNETNEVKMKQLVDKLANSKLSIDEGNYSTACTSQQEIQCLICGKSIEPGEDQSIRCPLLCNQLAQRASTVSSMQWEASEILNS
ncbi:hypothetical protein B9Z55_004360 [Caenorhabditis nigoni]|uniref:Uncharacterized protein n=1 Tax=Caenorhabditis nigoni TaxID=1611254 RepID=A0A2G5UW00_9PELO|nr:hypothetical protein B9Z55_004360 [Caenorhabditis nigoni]